MENEETNHEGAGEETQDEGTTEATTMSSDVQEDSGESAEAAGDEAPEEDTRDQQPETSFGAVLQGLCKATFIEQNRTLVIDLSSLQSTTARPGEVSETVARQFPAPIPVPQRRRGRRRQASTKQTPRVTASPKQTNGSEVNIEPGKKIKIHPPAPGMVVRADQTLMLKLSKDGSADILQTENFAYPLSSLTPETIRLRAKPTTNFLNFQEPQDGYRFAWLANMDKQEVIQIAKRGKFLPKEIESYMEKGYSEFMFAPGQSSRHFRLPDGTIVASKRMIDLSPEETKKEAKRAHNKPSTGTLVGALSGTLKS